MDKDQPNTPAAAPEQTWQEKVVDMVGQFCVTTEHNFRAMIAQATTLQPLPENKSFTLNTFCDGLMGITVHLICTFVGDSPGAEEIAVKAMRTKFAQMRADKLRTKIMEAGNVSPLKRH